MTPPTVHASSADTGLTRESFLGTLSTQLADVLQETVGLEDAHAFLAV